MCCCLLSVYSTVVGKIGETNTGRKINCHWAYMQDLQSESLKNVFTVFISSDLIHIGMIGRGVDS